MNKEGQIRNTAYQLIEQGNLNVADTNFTTSYIAHAEGKDYKGHEFIKRFANCKLPGVLLT